MPDRPEVVPAVVASLRAICLALPEARQEDAWVGTRWRVRTKTFAHVLVVADGWPPAYARAAGIDGPATVLTFRAAVPSSRRWGPSARRSSARPGTPRPSGWCCTTTRTGTRSPSC